MPFSLLTILAVSIAFDAAWDRVLQRWIGTRHTGNRLGAMFVWFAIGMVVHWSLAAAAGYFAGDAGKLRRSACAGTFIGVASMFQDPARMKRFMAISLPWSARAAIVTAILGLDALCGLLGGWLRTQH